jgi:hypothetical protein
MDSSRTARGTVLVFLLVAVIVSLASSVCAGSVSSAPAPVSTPPPGNSQHVDCNGNWVSHRDSADSRVISQYKNRSSGGFRPNGVVDAGSFAIPNPISNWTDQPVTGFSVCTESLHDGIPDQWKSNQGLSTTDPNLYKTVAPNGSIWRITSTGTNETRC